MFNTLRHAKMLEDVGFSREQAETSVKILVEIMEDKLASKQDLKDFKVGSAQDFKDLRHDMQELRVEVKQEIQDLRIEVKQDIQDLRHGMKELESRLTIRMGTMLAASIAILTAIQKLL